MSPFKNTGVIQVCVVPKSKPAERKPDCNAFVFSQSFSFNSGIVRNMSKRFNAPLTIAIGKDFANV